MSTFFLTYKQELNMTHEDNITLSAELMQPILENGADGLREAMEQLLNLAMKAERSQFLQADPWQRSDARQGYANGYKEKMWRTRLGELQLKVPQTRQTATAFYPSALERGQRSERAFNLALAEMYVQGVSTRRVNAIMEELCGTQVSSAMVSRAAAELDETLSAWRNRPLEETPYLMLDARYEKVRIGGLSTSCALLIAIGVNAQGKRSVIGVHVSLSEAEVHWRELLRQLKDRGIRGVRMITSDNHEGLKAALKATLSGVPWQRCQVHLQRNAAAHIPRQDMKEEVAGVLRSIFTAEDLPAATEKLERAVKTYEKTAPKLADWMENNVPQGLTVFGQPPLVRKRLRSTNMIERLNQEILRRTRVVGIFPNEASLLRLASAVTMEISDDWEAGKRYLKLNS